MDWRNLFPLIFLITCIDGFFSNYFYPQVFPLLFKDIFILLVYLLFFIYEGRQHWFFQFKRSIGSTAWYLAMLLLVLGGFQILNSGIPRLEVGFLGFKSTFFYWPLAILTYAYVDNLERARSLLKKVAYFAVPICLFGLYQFWQGPGYMVRTFGKGFERAIVMSHTGERGTTFLRIFGTFSSTGQFSAFLCYNTTSLFALLFTSRDVLERRFLNGCAALTIVTLLATGSRGALAVVVIAGSLLLILSRRFLRKVVFIFLLILSVYVGFSYLGKGVLRRFETLRDPELLKLRTIRVTRATFLDYLEQYPFGRGLGTGSPASRHILGEAKFLGEDKYTDWQLIENYPAKLQYEMGILGVILFYLFLINLTYRWLKYWLKVTDIRTSIFISTLSCLYLVIYWNSLFSIIESAPSGIFLWSGVGMVAKLAALQLDVGPFTQKEAYAVR